MRGSRLFYRVSSFKYLFRIHSKGTLTGVMGGSSSRSLSNAAANDFIQNAVKANCVVIFSKTTCGYCRMAKKVFEDMGTPFTAVELNKREDGIEIQKALEQITGEPTVPRVFVNGKCIGGGTETRQLQKQGQLIPLLMQCASPTQQPSS